LPGTPIRGRLRFPGHNYRALQLGGSAVACPDADVDLDGVVSQNRRWESDFIDGHERAPRRVQIYI